MGKRCWRLEGTKQQKPTEKKSGKEKKPAFKKWQRPLDNFIGDKEEKILFEDEQIILKANIQRILDKRE